VVLLKDVCARARVCVCGRVGEGERDAAISCSFCLFCLLVSFCLFSLDLGPSGLPLPQLGVGQMLSWDVQWDVQWEVHPRLLCLPTCVSSPGIWEWENKSLFWCKKGRLLTLCEAGLGLRWSDVV
jgi:hypothetical protein